MPELQIELRPAEVHDLNDLIELALSEAANRPDAAADAAALQCERLERQARGEVELLVAEHRGKLVGQLVLRWPDQPDRFGRVDRQDGADVEDVLVLPGFRGQGIGAEMIAHAEWRCMREGAQRIAASLDLTTHAPVVAWFEEMGYVRHGEAYPAGDTTSGAAVPDESRAVRVDLIKEL